MHQIRFRLGLCQRPRWGAYSAPPDPVAGFKGAYFQRKGKGEGKGVKGRPPPLPSLRGRKGRRGRKERGGRGRGGEGRGGDGRGEEGCPVFLLSRPGNPITY